MARPRVRASGQWEARGWLSHGWGRGLGMGMRAGMGMRIRMEMGVRVETGTGARKDLGKQGKGDALCVSFHVSQILY